MLMAVVLVVVAVVVSSIKYILYIVCSMPHYSYRVRPVQKHYLHLKKGKWYSFP